MKKVTSLSQLYISDQWGRGIGDKLCGPLCVYKILYKHKSLIEFKKFVTHFYPYFLNKKNKVDGIYLQDIIEVLNGFFKKKYKQLNLARNHRQKDLVLFWMRRFAQALKSRDCIVLEIACFHAKIKDGANHWQRGLGHFVLVRTVKALNVKDGYFEIEYWDPWNGKWHWGVVFEERFRDFASLKISQSAKKRLLRKSASGHWVQSPHLCLLLPQLDLYDPKVYFAQRTIYVLERAAL